VTTAPVATKTVVWHEVEFGCSRPGSCGTFKGYACPGIESGTCLCGRVLDGAAMCVALPPESACALLQPCSADSPCLDLEMVCFVDTCCDDESGQSGQSGRCFNPAPGACHNPAARLRLRAADTVRGGDLPCGAFRNC
jgi:hypothetical protein